MDVRFHCSKRVRHSGKKSKHRVMETCETLRQVLQLNPQYGVSIPRFSNLRKMRLRVPGLNVGKSGGYRLIYQVKEMDEAIHLIFLETYFKGDCEDLSEVAYRELAKTADEIFDQPMLYEWD